MNEGVEYDFSELVTENWLDNRNFQTFINNLTSKEIVDLMNAIINETEFYQNEFLTGLYTFLNAKEMMPTEASEFIAPTLESAEKGDQAIFVITISSKLGNAPLFIYRSVIKEDIYYIFNSEDSTYDFDSAKEVDFNKIFSYFITNYKQDITAIVWNLTPVLERLKCFVTRYNNWLNEIYKSFPAEYLNMSKGPIFNVKDAIIDPFYDFVICGADKTKYLFANKFMISKLGEYVNMRIKHQNMKCECEWLEITEKFDVQIYLQDCSKVPQKNNLFRLIRFDDTDFRAGVNTETLYMMICFMNLIPISFNLCCNSTVEEFFELSDNILNFNVINNGFILKYLTE